MLRGFAARIVRRCALVVGMVAAFLMCEFDDPRAARAQSDFNFPPPAAHEAVMFGGDQAQRWTRGAYDVWVLRGRCYVQQGAVAHEAQEAVLWVRRMPADAVAAAPEQTHVIAYLEGDVKIADARSGGSYQLRDRTWLGEFLSTAEPQVRTPPPTGEPSVPPQVFVNAQARRDALLAPLRAQAGAAAGVAPVQYQQPLGGTTNPAAAPIVELPATTLPSATSPWTSETTSSPLAGPTGLPGQFAGPTPGIAPAAPSQPYSVMQPGMPAPAYTNPARPNLGENVAVHPDAPTGRRLRAFSRSSVKVQVKWIPNPNNPQEWVGVISPGVNLIIDGLPGGVSQLDISTDRIMIWTSGAQEPDLSGAKTQGLDRPLEIYMEGNIVFREGDRVIYADRMYYNVNSRIGTILNAELLAPIPESGLLARFKADAIRQLGETRFLANNATLTTSRMTNPRYSLKSNELYFEDVQRPLTEPFSGAPVVDPLTGEQEIAHDRLATSTGNTVWIGPVPVFYWPRLATDLQNPNFYVRKVRVKSDSIFGQGVQTDFDMFQILGIKNKPKGHDWLLSADYFSERGPAAGTTYAYSGKNFLGFGGGRYQGILDIYGIQDDGLDILGSDRRDLEPEKHFRHRIFGQHRQELPDNFQLTAEVGWISDRNFEEQYFEKDYETLKDRATGFELKRLVDNTSISLSADYRLNKFFAETNQLPRLDHYQLGESLLGDTLTWYQHSSAEYAQLRTASFPRNPQEQAKFRYLPWEVTSSGERLVTAQEIDMPFDLGPIRMTPYALGQAGHWGEVLDGDDQQRLYGQTGVRAALPFWSVNPDIRSELFNVNGIAHKVVFDVDASFAQANRDLSEFPLYDQLDDNSQEQFRRRFAFNTFGTGFVPPQFDERSYALRSGLAGDVSNPSAEIADDLSAVRMGVRQRWQTKRGPPDKLRIMDWVVFDTEAVFFPRADRDNFGQNFGLVRYDFRWHVGDRLTLLSDGGFDFFDQGQQTVSVGAKLTRPTNGEFYIGYRSLEGPFSQQMLITSAAYRLSPKWFTSAALSYDFSGTGTVGNSFSLVRIGESFLVGFNFAYDAYKDNFSGMFVVEPRFLAGMKGTTAAGAFIPPTGLYGLE